MFTEIHGKNGKLIGAIPLLIAEILTIWEAVNHAI